MKTRNNPSDDWIQTVQSKSVTRKSLIQPVHQGLSRRHFLQRAGGATAVGLLGLGLPSFSGLVRAAGAPKDLDGVLRWSRIANDASGYDHGNAREQLGPGRSSRALAIAHIAMFDAILAVSGRYESYTGVKAPHGSISMEA